MTTIESKDLVIGQEYYDIPDTDLENATVLKFVGYDPECNSVDFKYVRGVKLYLDLNGIIPLGKRNLFYQP